MISNIPAVYRLNRCQAFLDGFKGLVTSSVLLGLYLALALSGMSPKNSVAQENSQDVLSKFIWDMFQMHQGKTLCAPEGVSVLGIRTNVVDHFKATGIAGGVSGEIMAKTLWNLYPCPFSPYRPELRAAASRDIEGVWVFPETSQKLRFGPRLGRQSPAGPLPVKCDAVGYYPDGELRHAIIAGQPKCPFEKAADLEVARKNPRVSSWSMLRDGRIGVSRTDIHNHIEEWDAYVVTSPFSVYGVQFAVGDLLAYVRRENGNEVGAASQFRHLQRLP